MINAKKNGHHKFPSLEVLVLSDKQSRIQNLRSGNRRKNKWRVVDSFSPIMKKMNQPMVSGLNLKQCYLVDHANMITKRTNQESSWQFSISEKCLELCVSRFPFTFFNHFEPLSSGLHLKEAVYPFLLWLYQLQQHHLFCRGDKPILFCVCVFLLKSCLAYLYLQLHQPPDETHTGPSADKVSQATRYIHHSPT